ncbi:MAG: HAMP domain-containing sensor histidine kinase [Nannocystaceae bacterium]
MSASSVGLGPAARALLEALLAEERAAIIDAGVDWITRASPDLQGRRPREETVMLLEREFTAYADLILRDDPGARDAFIEFTTTYRASAEFRISTLLRGFLCFRHGVAVLLRRRGDPPELHLEILEAVDQLYFDATFRMADVYAEKLLAVLQRTQEQMRAREKMAALGGLVAGMAHEISTPIGVAVTSSSLVQRRLETLQETFVRGELRRSTLATFFHEAGQASDINVQNLLRAAELIDSFKQVAVDQTHSVKRRVELGAYLREVLASLTPMLRRCPHRVDVTIGGPIDTMIHAGAISQIVTNLVQNAILHAFEPASVGVIQIELREGAGATYELRVADNGRGMGADESARLFEPFFTTKRGAGGSGLGMHIVHNLVHDLLGGTITVESQPGVGTSILIRGPVERPLLVSEHG